MRVIFLCVANAARSQMAEGLARARWPDAVVESAGTEPKELHPLAIAALQEVGIDISHQVSKSVSQFDLTDFDAVITLCAEESCPLVPASVKRLHWPLPDPAQDGLASFRKVRDEITRRLAALDR